MYQKCKGNEFKNKRVLMEHIHMAKAEQVREKSITQQAEARKEKAKQKKERRAANINEKEAQRAKDVAVAEKAARQ